MDILNTIYYLSQMYELESIKNLPDDKQEILRLKTELKNIRDNISFYISKVYTKVPKETQEILDNISLRVGIKNF